MGTIQLLYAWCSRTILAWVSSRHSTRRRRDGVVPQANARLCSACRSLVVPSAAGVCMSSSGCPVSSFLSFSVIVLTRFGSRFSDSPSGVQARWSATFECVCSCLGLLGLLFLGSDRFVVCAHSAIWLINDPLFTGSISMTRRTTDGGGWARSGW